MLLSSEMEKDSNFCNIFKCDTKARSTSYELHLTPSNSVAQLKSIRSPGTRTPVDLILTSLNVLQQGFKFMSSSSNMPNIYWVVNIHYMNYGEIYLYCFSLYIYIYMN